MAAEFFFDGVEVVGHVFDALGVEGAAAGGDRHGFEDVVAAVAVGAGVGADGVDDGFGALTHFDGVVLVGAAHVVVSVGDDDDGFAQCTFGFDG